MVTIKQKIEWDSAHRVMRHESKCSTLHGHRYVALVEVTSVGLDSCDRVVDFGVIKTILGKWIDENWDHTTLVNQADVELLAFVARDALHGRRHPFVFDGEPTAETIADALLRKARQLLQDQGPHGDQRLTPLKIVSVEVFETPNCSAKAS